MIITSYAAPTGGNNSNTPKAGDTITKNGITYEAFIDPKDGKLKKRIKQ